MWGQCISQHFVKYVDSIKTHRQKKRKKNRHGKGGGKQTSSDKFVAHLVQTVWFPLDLRVVARRGGVGEEGRETEWTLSNCSSMWKGDKRKVWKGSPDTGGIEQKGWIKRGGMNRKEKDEGEAVIRLEGCKDVALFGTIASLKITFRYFMSVGRSVLCSSLTKNPKFPKANMSCCFGICCQCCIPVVKLHGRVWSTNLLFPYV